MKLLLFGWIILSNYAGKALDLNDKVAIVFHWDEKVPGPLSLCHKTLAVGVSNGHKNFPSARKIWPLLDLLAKFRRVLACSCSQNFCNCSHARILVKICSIAQNFVNPATLALSKCT